MQASNTELELFFLKFRSHKIRIGVTYFSVFLGYHYDAAWG